MAMPAPLPKDIAQEVMSALGLSQEELARVLGVSARTVTRWLKARDIRLEERLAEVDDIIREARRVLRPETIPRWFRVSLDQLGGLRPLDLLASPTGKKRIRSVLAEIRWGILG